jgi:transposase InsO family protein
MSRQNYYAARRLRRRRQVDESLIVELVRRERRFQPRLGGRKLLYMLRPDFEEAGVSIGRDRFFELLAESDLLVVPKPGKPRTTNSRHSLPVFWNLLKDKELGGPNEAWVSDLTYIRTDEGFLYAALITDAYSRKIVGAHIGESLETQGCLAALEEALKELPEGKRPIHHSDRGCQYCCHEYVDRLRGRGMQISMTGELHCYENALAERINGILKQEYEMDRGFRAKEQAKAAFKQAVWLYNERRPHMRLWAIGFQRKFTGRQRRLRRERQFLSCRVTPLALRATPTGTGSTRQDRNSKRTKNQKQNPRKKCQMEIRK